MIFKRPIGLVARFENPTDTTRVCDGGSRFKEVSCGTFAYYGIKRPIGRNVYLFSSAEDATDRGG